MLANSPSTAVPYTISQDGRDQSQPLVQRAARGGLNGDAEPGGHGLDVGQVSHRQSVPGFRHPGR